jgi:hypothetical protein
MDDPEEDLCNNQKIAIRHPERSEAKSKDQFRRSEWDRTKLSLRQAQDDGAWLS